MRRLLTVFCVVILISGVVSAAGRGSRADIDSPHRYLPNALDGAPVQAANPVDGRLWSAWSYRNGAEYDLALSVSVAPGVWSEPQFIGLGDGIDQQQPAITVDARGVTYIAFADDGSIRLTALQPGGSLWSPPISVAVADRAFSNPSLMVIGDALIVGYRDGAGVALQALPLLPPEYANAPRSIYDGPDPTTGANGDEGDEGDSESSKDEPAVLGLTTNAGVTITPQGNGQNDDDR
ncbi:MAG: hypothetical protein GTO30_14550 [Acidobacteria bacterium]|nr:hypothetical protein [Acidobacteriota bacterium]NIQ84933.1 hypothetical protein [Acidobacteriota bacterium]